MLSTKVKEAMGPLFPVANKIRLMGLKIKYAGNKVYCPCCKSSFREFAPFGDSRRKNAWCPNCQGLERHRLLWMYFENKTDILKRPIRLLHIAPEDIFFNLFKKQANIDYHPVDIYPHMYPKGTKYFDLLNPAADTGTYDVIICNHVFQYIEDDKKAISNIYDLIKPGGWGIMQVPINGKNPLPWKILLLPTPWSACACTELKNMDAITGSTIKTGLRLQVLRLRKRLYP